MLLIIKEGSTSHPKLTSPGHDICFLHTNVGPNRIRFLFKTILYASSFPSTPILTSFAITSTLSTLSSGSMLC
uniref:Uncharacterized protein n=1 Tax=Lotus japonicus TaxID=34305 RepID=I3T8U6_LOTJA|nr:unknown [Lotus japonicus]